MFNKNKKYILDGGGGQTLLDLGLKPLGALWSATALIDEKYNHLVTKMHQQFIDAGSDLIVTNNFSVRKIRLKEFNKVHMFEEALLKAALLAKKAKEDSGKKDLIIAGSIPSKGIVYSAQKMLDDKEVYEEHFKTAEILNSHVDIFYLDVLSSISEVRIAFDALKEFNKPILIGAHFIRDGVLPSGETVSDLIKISKDINCCGIIAACTNHEVIKFVLPELNKQNLPFGFKVNAWKEVPENNPQDWVYKTTNPGDMYGSIADQFTPEVFKDYVLKSSDTGATLFGGCCEIKPKHIKALKNLFY